MEATWLESENKEKMHWTNLTGNILFIKRREVGKGGEGRESGSEVEGACLTTGLNVSKRMFNHWVQGPIHVASSVLNSDRKMQLGKAFTLDGKF